jgi:hypothetical protein
MQLEETARALAMSRRGVYNLIRRGLLRPVYIDRRPRFDAADLAALIEQAKASLPEPPS